MAIRPKSAPFRVGVHVVYPGNGFKRNESEWVRPGDVGVVVAVRQGTPGYPELGEEFAEPFDSWSVVRFHDDPRTDCAITRDSVRREKWDGSIEEWKVAR